MKSRETDIACAEPAPLFDPHAPDGLTVSLILALLGSIIQYTVQTNLMHSVDRDLVAKARPPFRGRPPGGLFGMLFRRDPPPPSAEPSRAVAPNRNGEAPNPSRTAGNENGTDEDPHPAIEFRPRFIDLDGKSFSPFREEVPWDRTGYGIALNGSSNYRTVLVNEEPVRIYSRPLYDNGTLIGVIQVPYSLVEVNRAIAGMRRTLLTLIPAALLLAGIGGALLTDRALRPVRQIVQTAEQIGAHDLSRRITVVGHDEFSLLGTTFNRMLGRLETSFVQKDALVEQLEALVEQQRRFTGDASHELRTPLTIIKANASLILRGDASSEEYREVMEEVDRAADTMARLVQDLLLLARSDGGQLGRNLVALPLCEVLERARLNIQRPDTAPIRLEAVHSHGVTICGNGEEIRRLFSNLLENATRYTPKEGVICVRVLRESTTVRIEVADTGIGIAPEHLPHLGERFYRVDEARTRADGGTGLGLSICKSIVEAHGGTLYFVSTPGKGTTVTVLLPLLTESADTNAEAA